MKWAFLLGSASISGGTNVIFEHAVRNYNRGEEITIITEVPVDMKELDWHPEAKCLRWATYSEVKEEEFDCLIVTWWRTAYEAYRVRAKRYFYFVQSVESKFYSPEELPIRHLAEASYMIPFDFITEATWIKEYLKENYNVDAQLVKNGIRKDFFKRDGEAISPKNENKLRVLVEGTIESPFKNVKKTIELCKQSEADEIWLLTSSNVKSYDGVDKVISRIPIGETPKVYRSCDVLVKLSYVEGMFGPPLEIFHCGGTAITYDVTGHDEYIINNYNALVVGCDKEKEVIRCINQLKNDKKTIDRLKKGAAQTAKEWIDWDESARQFGIAIRNGMNVSDSRNTQSEIERISKFHFRSYVIAEDYYNELKRIKAVSLKQRIWYKVNRFDKIKKLLPNDFKQKIKDILGVR